jgi:hypothetical protein
MKAKGEIVKVLKRVCIVLLGLGLMPAAWAGSVTLGGVVDEDDGRSFDLSGRFAATSSWTLGAGVGHSESQFEGEKFSGNTLSVSSDLALGAFFLGAAANRWKDSGDLRATVLRGELGWMSDAGIAVSALVTNRATRIEYTANVLGQLRERQVDFEGTGFGGDVSYLGEQWTAGVRFLSYDYGNNVERVKQLMESGDTQRFPVLARLIGSVATRTAGSPDRELSFMLGHEFGKVSLTADVQLLRDALTGDKTTSSGLTLGFKPAPRFSVDVSGGVTDSDVVGTVPWAGLSLTLRSAN